MRPQAERCPHSADRGVGNAGFRRSSSGSTSALCRPQRPLDHRSNLIVVDGSRPATAGLVKQAITAILQKLLFGLQYCPLDPSRLGRPDRLRQHRFGTDHRFELFFESGLKLLATNRYRP